MNVNCAPLLSLAALALAACGGCTAPDQSAYVSSSLTGPAASQHGSGGNPGLDADAAKPLKPCHCPNPDYWLKVEGDGDAQVFTFPNPALGEHNCQPTEPSAYGWVPSCAGPELYVIGSCAGQDIESGCILLDQRYPPGAQYIDRAGTTWALSNLVLEISPPPAGYALYPPFTGRYSTTATSPKSGSLLLHGTFWVCLAWGGGVLC